MATDDSNDMPTTYGINQPTCSVADGSSSNLNIVKGSQPQSSMAKTSEAMITSQSSSSITAMDHLPHHQQQQSTESITPSSSTASLSSSSQHQSSQQQQHPRIQRKPVLWTDNPQRLQQQASNRGQIMQHGHRMRNPHQQQQQRQQLHQQPSEQQNIRGLPRPPRRGINRNRRNFRFQ